MEIAPSILSADQMNMGRDVLLAEESGADLLHVDIMDGHFVSNITFGMGIIKALKEITKVPLDVHLMIDHPEPYLKTAVEYGADMVLIHAEATPHIHGAIQTIHNLGAKAGVVINPGTPVESIIPILDIVDQVLVMTVNPGFGGQKFIHAMTKKIELLDKIRKENEDCDFKIEVDGGVDNKTVKECFDAGANVFVAGSYVFNSDDVAGRIKSLRLE